MKNSHIVLSFKIFQGNLYAARLERSWPRCRAWEPSDLRSQAHYLPAKPCTHKQSPCALADPHVDYPDVARCDLTCEASVFDVQQTFVLPLLGLRV